MHITPINHYGYKKTQTFQGFSLKSFNIFGKGKRFTLSDKIAKSLPIALIYNAVYAIKDPNQNKITPIKNTVVSPGTIQETKSPLEGEIYSFLI